MSRRTRNSKLSAFYGLGASEQLDSHAPHGSPAKRHVMDDGALDNDQPTMSTSSAVQYAENLIRTQSLVELLNTIARSRKEQENARVQWHTALVRCYEQLEKASSIATTTKIRAGDMHEDQKCLLNAAREHAAIASRINMALEPSRKAMTALEGPRQLDILVHASNILINELPTHYHGLVDLCLDQETAKQKFLVTCVRYAALVPLFDRLATCDKTTFEVCCEQLKAASTAIRIDLEERLSKGNGCVEGIELPDIIRIRYSLGDPLVDLRQIYLTAAHDQLRSKQSRCNFSEFSNESPLSISCSQLSRVKEELLPELFELCDNYFKLFTGHLTEKDEWNDSANIIRSSHPSIHPSPHLEEMEQEIALWLLHIVNTCLGNPVRGTLSDRELGMRWKKNSAACSERQDEVAVISLTALLNEESNSTSWEICCIGSVADAERFRACLDAVRSDALRRRSMCTNCVSVPLVEIIGNICNDLDIFVMDLVLQSARTHLFSTLDTLLNRDFVTEGRIDIESLEFVRQMDDVQDDVDEYFTAMCFDRVKLVDEVFDQVIQKSEVWVSTSVEDLAPWSLRFLLSAAVLCDYLCRNCRQGDIAPEEKKNLLRHQLIRLYSAVTARHVAEILQRSLAEYISAENNRLDTPFESGTKLAISILERAQQEISVILNGIQDMQIVMGTQEDVLDESGIVQRIARSWVFIVREQTFDSVHVVHRLQLDAVALARAVALPNAFDSVPQAAISRCTQVVETLDSSEISA